MRLGFDGREFKEVKAWGHITLVFSKGEFRESQHADIAFPGNTTIAVSSAYPGGVELLLSSGKTNFFKNKFFKKSFASLSGNQSEASSYSPAKARP